MPKASILIVEDSATAEIHLRHTLEAEGYDVIGSCDSGETALAFVEERLPDLVMMDIIINGPLDGIQTASILKRRFNLPCVFLTGLTDKQTVDRAKFTEAHGYLSKPLERHAIVPVIEMALYKHDIESQLRRSEEKYFSTVSSISDAVVAVDRDCLVTFMNPAALSMTGWKCEDVVGRSVAEVLSCRRINRPESIVNPVQCTLGKGNLSRIPDDLFLVCKSGNRIPIGESSMSPLHDSHGNFAGLIIIFRDITGKFEQEKLRREIERNRKAAIIEGQERERGRIAMDLHDGLGQMLNAIKMNTGFIVSDPAAAQSLLLLLDEAIMESVRISENLLPSKLKDFDLATCLKTLCKTMSKSSHTRIDFIGNGSRIPMTQSNKVNFFRITQEALSNAVKHAKANTITVQLNASSDTIRLSVEDDGKGMTQATPSTTDRGNGLINMRDRAEIMGGQFIVESDGQRGTFLIVEVPNTQVPVYV
jgi:PAS domain S-box-containing protein